jgi:hypothetical protein
MNCNVVASVAVIGALLAGQANAQVSCPTGEQVTNLNSFLVNRTACAALPGGDKWQERHAAGSALIDYKLGSSHPVDPTKQVGTWSATATTVTYDYGAGGTYTYIVCAVPTVASATSYTFVPAPTGTLITGAQLIGPNTTDVPCP